MNEIEQERDIIRIQRLRREAMLKKQKRRRRIILLGGLILLLVIGLIIGQIWRAVTGSAIDLESIVSPSWIEQDFIDMDGHARDGSTISEVRDIAIHYVGNPDTTAKANRDYFNQDGVDVSSHFIVGLEGEIVQCLPLNEKSAATNERNYNTISIEVCHPDDSGKFSDKTYASLIRLTAWLCEELKLDGNHLIRHYDVTGKLCPLYYVENEDAWKQLKADVDARIAYDKESSQEET